MVLSTFANVGSHWLIGSSSDKLPSSAICRMIAATNDFVLLSISNSISVRMESLVTGLENPPAPSHVPFSGKMMAADAPIKLWVNKMESRTNWKRAASNPSNPLPLLAVCSDVRICGGEWRNAGWLTMVSVSRS